MQGPGAEVIFEALPDGVLVVDGEGCVVRANAKAVGMVGARGGDGVLGVSVGALLGTTTPGALPWSTGLRRLDGAVLPVEVTATTPGQGFTLYCLRDVGERRRRTQRIEFLSTHDPLTGLGNRAAFDDAVTQLDAHGPWPVGVLMVDVDGLKQVNDERGHLAGDELLKQVASLLRKTFRESDLLARLGGDEFTVLAAGHDLGAVDVLARRLELARTKASPPVSFSVGQAVAKAGQRVRDALQMADARMYLEKQRHHAAVARAAQR